MAQAQLALRALRLVMKPDGFNMGINEGKVAGAGFADHMRAGMDAGRWHWVSNEGPGVFSHTEHLQRDRAGFVLSLDLRPLGYAGPHGSWLEWFDE